MDFVDTGVTRTPTMQRVYDLIDRVKLMTLKGVVSSENLLLQIVRPSSGENRVTNLRAALAKVLQVARIEVFQDFSNPAIQRSRAQEVTVRLSRDGEPVWHLDALRRQLAIHLTQ